MTSAERTAYESSLRRVGGHYAHRRGYRQLADWMSLGMLRDPTVGNG